MGSWSICKRNSDCYTARVAATAEIIAALMPGGRFTRRNNSFGNFISLRASGRCETEEQSCVIVRTTAAPCPISPFYSSPVMEKYVRLHTRLSLPLCLLFSLHTFFHISAAPFRGDRISRTVDFISPVCSNPFLIPIVSSIPRRFPLEPGRITVETAP